MEAPYPFDCNKAGSKTKRTFWNRIGKQDLFSISALVDIVDSVDHECEREVLIELDDFDDCVEEKEDADFSLD